MTSGLELAIGAKNMIVLMRERTTVAWEQLRLSQILSGAALQAPLDKFVGILEADRFLLSSAHTTLPIRTTWYFAGALQDCADVLGDITLKHRFCTAALW